MVGTLTLVVDISSVAISTAVPGIAWALLFALAWRRPRFADSLGLGPRTFWLLLPGALLASFALLPITPVSDDVVAVSFAGAVFPLAVGVLVLDRVAPPLRRSALRLFVPLVVETTLLLGVVLLADAGRLAGLARDLGLSGWGAELVLVVAVARDNTIRKRKKREPLINEGDRVRLLSSLRDVDAAILGVEGDIYVTLQKVDPDIVALGYDQYHMDDDVKREAGKRGMKLKVVRLDSPYLHIRTTRILSEL